MSGYDDFDERLLGKFGMFDYCRTNDDGSLSKYEWKNKLLRFNKFLWHQQFSVTDLQKEIAYLAFESAYYTAHTALEWGDYTLVREIRSEIDAKERENEICTHHWDLVRGMIKDVPIVPADGERLLTIVDKCAKHLFRKDIKRRTLEDYENVCGARRASGNLKSKLSIQEVESRYPCEDWGEWEKLKSFARDGDEFWDYCTDQESWNHLAGESGIAMTRGDYIIAEIMICIN